jgi:multidrug efflux pump
VRSVFIGIKVAPDANILDVAKRVREAFPAIRDQLPSGLTGKSSTTPRTSSTPRLTKW